MSSEATQACTTCQAEYPASHYRRPGPGRQWSRCENCRQPERRHSRRQPKRAEQTRRYNLQSLYGITPEQYDDRRAAQDYRCAICGRHEGDIPERRVGRPRLDGQPSAAAMKLHVDHDHETNDIRGLLCGWCNSGLSNFQDDPNRMIQAIAYLQGGGVH